MRIVSTRDIAGAVSELCVEACCVLPERVVQRLMEAREQEAGHSAAREVLSQLIENARLAREAMRPCCQDTGMAVVFWTSGWTRTSTATCTLPSTRAWRAAIRTDICASRCSRRCPA